MGVPDRRRAAPLARARRERTRSVALRWFAAVLLAGLTAAAFLLLAQSQARSRTGLEDRFDARGALSADFVAAYATQLLDHEHTVAVASLGGDTPQRAFDAVTAALGFRDAVLLDDQGRVLAISPASPAVLGREVASTHPHLSVAVAGTRAVSPVVPSAADSQPVVAFAVPFTTGSGRRVLAGAFATRDNPLQSYLDGFSSLPGYRALVVDRSGTVVSASGRALGSEAADVARELGSARTRGVVAGTQRGTYVAVHDIAGTPWRLVTAVPVATLLAPVSGASSVLPWMILAGMTVAVGMAFWLGLRLLEGRVRLQRAIALLDELASQDALTGVANRRRSVEVLERELARCVADELPVSVLLIDVDHFKRVNDTFGHVSGDEVLREVAVRLGRALRDVDVLGRWGGEEFLVVLPASDLFDARSVAERLREAVAAEPIAVGTGGDAIDVTVSIGVASTTHSGAQAGFEVLVHTADRALYAAKAAGRNLVIATAR